MSVYRVHPKIWMCIEKKVWPKIRNILEEQLSIPLKCFISAKLPLKVLKQNLEFGKIDLVDKTIILNSTCLHKLRKNLNNIPKYKNILTNIFKHIPGNVYSFMFYRYEPSKAALCLILKTPNEIKFQFFCLDRFWNKLEFTQEEKKELEEVKSKYTKIDIGMKEEFYYIKKENIYFDIFYGLDYVPNNEKELKNFENIKIAFKKETSPSFGY